MRIRRIDPPTGLFVLAFAVIVVSLAARPDAGAQIATAPQDTREPGVACQQLFEQVTPYRITGEHRDLERTEHETEGERFTLRRTTSGTDGELPLQVEYACVFDSHDDPPRSLEITGHYY